jgi:hypothetical protein
MRASTALRVASVIVAAKAVLIGVIYWRRAEILGHPLHIGAASWMGFATIVAVGLGAAAALHIAAHRLRGGN